MDVLFIAVLIMIVMTVVLTVYGVSRVRKNLLIERLRIVQTKSGKILSLQEKEFEKSFFQRVIKPVIERMGKKFAKVSSSSANQKINEMLIVAGNPWDLSPEEFSVIQIFFTLLTGGVTLLVVISMKLEIRMILIFPLVGLMAGYIIPRFFLAKLGEKRKRRIEGTLPDVLDLLCISVEAGLGFDQAMQRVIIKAKGPLSEEFGRFLQDVKMGSSRKDALRAIVQRTKVHDLETFISSIVQAETMGVSIGNILRIQSKQMRTKRKQRVEEKAMKAPLKMSFPLVLFIFPTIFIIIFGPFLLNVMKHFNK